MLLLLLHPEGLSKLLIPTVTLLTKSNFAAQNGRVPEDWGISTDDDLR